MATQQTNFFQSVATFAKPFVKAGAKPADPFAQAKAKFLSQADEQLKLIKAGTDKGFWFKKIGTGYVVNLKNGAKVLKDCSFAVGSVADATKLLEQAKEAASKGEFDEQLKATMRTPRKAKDGEPSGESKGAAPAAAPAEEPAKGNKKK